MKVSKHLRDSIRIQEVIGKLEQQAVINKINLNRDKSIILHLGGNNKTHEPRMELTIVRNTKKYLSALLDHMLNMCNAVVVVFKYNLSLHKQKEQ